MSTFDTIAFVRSLRPWCWAGDPLHERAGQAARIKVAGNKHERENHNREAAWLYRLRRVTGDPSQPQEPARGDGATLCEWRD